ncbi:kinase-like protein [Armillaria solidipes]|uniref:Kinase-like protein n=1 Tax=Armillaria solidipes TaxID=1076256 RepID=A0A2H3AJA4_9AGAR|nr:kinase-like protein [Armillaria solidipes]
MKSLRALSEERDIFPESFQCANIIKKGELPFSGGGSAVSAGRLDPFMSLNKRFSYMQDVWKGEMDGRPVCLKVLRIFTSRNQVEKLLKQLRREAIVWRQLRHENILPFLGVNSSYFIPSYCFISPWMQNGSLISFLELHPDHDRLQCVRDIANAVEFMHSLDPQVIHGDIRGCNILVTEYSRCCLADFGASIITSTMAPSTATMSHNSTPWMAPELLEYSSKLYDQSLLTGRDVYAFGCTIVEVNIFVV